MCLAWLLFRESPLDHEVSGAGGVAFVEAARLEHALEVLEHGRAAADHHAVGGGLRLKGGIDGGRRIDSIVS